ncbi:hypothetical protein SX4_2187 [Vibrio mimicus SX-4]|nr:hypothetical protein SX4_2187 [Vibrio mimicus SX-4]
MGKWTTEQPHRLTGKSFTLCIDLIVSLLPLPPIMALGLTNMSLLK